MTKEKTKNSSFSNVMYMLKILWHGSKGYVIYTFIKEFNQNVFWTIFSVYLTEWIYVAIENETPFTVLASFVGAMCIGHICIHIMCAIHQLCEKQFLPKMYRDFYKRVIRKSISMEYAEFERPDFYDKYTRALNECQQRGSTILYYSAYLVAGIASVIAATVIVADVDPWLLLFIVPMVAVSMFFGKKEGEIYYSLDMSNTRDGRIGSYAKRVFYEKKYASELRIFGIGKLLLSRHEKAYEEMEERTRKMRRKLCIIEPVKWILYSILSTILPYLYIAFVLNSGEAQTAAYVAMIPALATLSWRTSDAVELIVALAKESAFVTNLREFLSYEPKTDANELIKAENLSDIEINDMGFTYEGADKPTLHDVNISIRKGEKIAVVGQNGAGKTTLVKLIMGLYSPTEGAVRISGEDTAKYEPKSLHRRFGTVFQDLQVFALPLSHNVLMRKPKNEEERRLVEDSLRKAQFGDKLDSLENGIDTMVTKEFDENGIALSGGEAQKIAIARVFARKPDIVILDEPSSALDPIAEYNMYKNMLTATDGETVIFISHRLSATRDADRIYMFEQGTIIEQGSHAELMALNGKYAEMWKLQAQNYLAEEVTA
ncbi:MAG: ABC transporter ATP-binding protein [Huintestinicola sp.]|uniref:ABC transporter ATP-binding protein n=1 Tax=Huintestinicola sp. TaxID=2981661 RepID=UPI003EFDACE0